MKRHLMRWGAAYILLAFFLGSWWGQYVTGWDVYVQEQEAHLDPIDRSEYMAEFWQATLENWQSEWLQLVGQSVLLLGLGHLIFKADKEDMERLEAKVDRALKEVTDVNLRLMPRSSEDPRWDR